MSHSYSNNNNSNSTRSPSTLFVPTRCWSKHLTTCVTNWILTAAPGGEHCYFMGEEERGTERLSHPCQGPLPAGKLTPSWPHFPVLLSLPTLCWIAAPSAESVLFAGVLGRCVSWRYVCASVMYPGTCRVILSCFSTHVMVHPATLLQPSCLHPAIPQGETPGLGPSPRRRK